MIFDTLPGVPRPSPGRGQPVTGSPLEALAPLAQIEIEEEVVGERLAAEAMVAAPRERLLPLAIPNEEFDIPPGQSVVLEEWPLIGTSLAAPVASPGAPRSPESGTC